MKKILSTFFLVICSLQMSSLHAQLPERDSIYICQYVKDSFTKHGIPGVYVTLADSNGVLIDTMWTERRYGSKDCSWDNTVARKPQSFLLKAEHPDYETVVQRVEMTSPARRATFFFPELLMKRRIKETTMDVLEVKATRIQLAYKGDTIVVDAEAFKIPEGSMLDGLVARVPGAELRDDGTIYMNGRKVDYLTLNGKDFFKGRNRIMLDNLPYYVVSKLKFYEKDVPLSQMVHSDTGEKDYVMDVVLKQEYSIGYMANVEAGAGTNERWMARLFGLRFTDNSRLVLFGNVNNTNDMRSPGGDSWEGKPSVQTGEKTTKMIGGSIRVDDKNHRYGENAEAVVRWTDDRNETRTSRETFLQEGSVFGRMQDAMRSKDLSASLRNELKLDRLRLNFKTTLGYSNQDGEGMSRSASFISDPSAHGTCIQILDSMFSSPSTSSLHRASVNRVLDQTMYGSTSCNMGQEIGWGGGLPWGDDLYIKVNANYGRDERDGFSRYDLTYTDQSQPDDRRDRFTPYRHHNYEYGGEAFYRLYMFHRWFIDSKYSYAQRYDDTDSRLYRLDALATGMDFGILPSQEEYLQTIDMGNSYRNGYMTRTHRLSLVLKRTLNTDRHTLLYGIGTHVMHKGESSHYWRSGNWHDISRGHWLAEPTAYFEYRPENKRRLTVKLHYDCQAMTPDLVQMLDIMDTSNPLALTMGNPDLKVSRRHQTSLYASRGRFGSAMWLDMKVNILENMVANGFTYNQASGVYTYRPENVKGNWNGVASLNWNRFLDSDKRLMLKGRTAYDYVRNIDLARVDGFSGSRRSKVDHHITSQNVNLSYNKESLRLDVVGDFAWNVARRELEGVGDINAFDFSYGISGQYTFPWKLQVSTDMKMYSRRGYGELAMNSDELVWNASVSYPFLKGRLVVKVDAFDMLNQLSDTRNVVNGQGRTETWRLTMPRYAMLRIAYRFNKNPKNK